MRAARAHRISGENARATAWRAASVHLGTPVRTRRGRAARVTLAVVGACLLALVGLLVTGRSALPAPVLTGDGTPRVPVPADARPERLLPLVSPPAGEGGYELLVRQFGRPVLFDPCRPVHWVMRPAGAPPGAEALLQDAFATLSRATGPAFVHDGETDEAYDEDRELVQPERYGARYAPVLVLWSHPREAEDLEGDVGGFAGPRAGHPDGAGSRLLSGVVVLDAPQIAAMADAAGPAGVVLHELGHLVGLDHVDDPADSMHSRPGPATGYTAGALRGLAAAGSGACFPSGDS